MSDMPCDDETRKEEHGTSVFTSPISRWKLEVREEGESIADGGQRGLSWWQSWEILYVYKLFVGCQLGKGPCYGWKPYMVLVGCTLWPCLELLIAVQIVPSLSASFIQQSPSRVICFFCCDIGTIFQCWLFIPVVSIAISEFARWPLFSCHIHSGQCIPFRGGWTSW